MKTNKSRLCALAVGLLAAPLISWGGNIYMTGHDLDFHCDGNQQCNAFGAAINFVRSGAPNPLLPILFVDSGSEMATSAGNAATRARNTIDPGGIINFTVVTPTAFSAAGFSLSTSSYSAIAFASAASCGGCDLSPADITAINTRTSAIQAFFNAGGGLFYNAGANDRATYYASVPIPASAVAVSAPFTLTTVGKAAPFSLIEGVGSGSDDNCCATHNSFTLPGAGSPLIVLETDAAGFAETLAGGNVTITSGGFGGGGVPEPATFVLLGVPLGLFVLTFLARRKAAKSAS